MAMDYRDSSELQLLEVSRGVRKLTQMIDSWSKAPNLDARSKYIAKDLLRDSLALQESLITIRRLQETSRMMSFMEQKHESGFIKERHVEEEEECGSLRFGVGIYDGIIHSLTTNGSSWNHVNGAIGGELNKQNHGFFASNRSIEFPTSTGFSSTENSKGLKDLTMRAKAPNLIAKLMGLEKIPSQVVQSASKEQENDKDVYKQALDYENSRIRRSNSNGSEEPAIVIMKPLQSSHETRGEGQKKKENLPSELSSKKKVSDDEQMGNRRKAIKRMNKASMELSPKLRTQTSATHKQQRKEPTAMFLNKVSILNGKTPEERRDVKVNSAPLFQTKRVIEPPAKPDRKLAGARADCTQSSTFRKNVSITNGKTISKLSATYLMGEEKKKAEKVSVGSKNIKTANTKCKGVSKRTEPSNRVSYICRSFSSPSINGFPQLGYGENTRMGKNQARSPDQFRPNQLARPMAASSARSTSDDLIGSLDQRRPHKLESKTFCEIMPKDSKGGKQSSSVEAAAMPPYEKPLLASKEAAEPQKEIKLLLLTSPDFLTRAEELFGFDVQIYRAKSYQNCKFEEFGARNRHELLLGCAMELMARKSFQLELLNHHPMRGTYQKNSKLLKSLEQLAEEVGNGIEELNDYCRDGDLKDDLYWRLERDISCKNEFFNALWDFGWISLGFRVEEFGGVVEQIGELIICGIVGDVAFDLLL